MATINRLSPSGPARRIQAVHRRIERAAAKSGRTASDILLVAAIKTQPNAVLRSAWDDGLVHWGENRPEAMAERLTDPDLQALDIRWHLIGPLQSRKAKLLPPHIHMVHSVDRLKTGALLSRLGEATGRRVPILLQVNPAREASKQGVSLEEAQDLARHLNALPGIELQGLMAMTPWGLEASALRKLFGLVQQKLHELQRELPQARWRHLSMGMSQDFELAIEEGATIVRIGTALFGERSA